MDDFRELSFRFDQLLQTWRKALRPYGEGKNELDGKLLYSMGDLVQAISVAAREVKDAASTHSDPMALGLLAERLESIAAAIRRNLIAIEYAELPLDAAIWRIESNIQDGVNIAQRISDFERIDRTSRLHQSFLRFFGILPSADIDNLLESPHLEHLDEVVRLIESTGRIPRRLVFPEPRSAYVVLENDDLADRAFDDSSGIEDQDSASVAVYLDSSDDAVIDSIVRSVNTLGILVGLDLDELDVEVTRGSIFRRWRKSVETGISPQTRSLLVDEVRRALEFSNSPISSRLGNDDAANVVSGLLDKLEMVDNACVRVDSLLIIKYQGPSGSTVLVSSLSESQIGFLERNPELQQHPDKLLESLSAIVE